MLSFIVAASENNVIGKEGELPWRLSTDLRRFKALTMGHAVILGRKTFDSILRRLGKPLPGRELYVFTRQTGFRYPGVHTMDTGDLERLVAAREDVFVI